MENNDSNEKVQFLFHLLFVQFTSNDTLVPLKHHEIKTTQMNLFIINTNFGLLQLESTTKVC